MTELDLEERRKAAYDKLAELVHEFSAIDEADGSPQSFPTAWVLLVGYEAYDAGSTGVAGASGIYPKDGLQPQWKTRGMIDDCLFRLNQSSR